MEPVAQRGQQYLIALSDGSIEAQRQGMGQILNVREGTVSDVRNLQSFLARGYWEEYDREFTLNDLLRLSGVSESQLGENTAQLANRYSEGDVVETPDGIGVVAAVITETVENDALAEADGVPDTIEGSADSPMYGVVIEDESRGVDFYRASDLEAGEIATDIDPLGSIADEDTEAMCPAALGEPAGEQTAELGWSPPESWRESDTPTRLILLDAFSSMGGKHGGSDGDGCVETMRGKVANPDKYCGAFVDAVYAGYDFWRGDSFLPGD